MADHLVGGCLFTVRTTNLIEIPVDESYSTTVEQTMKRGLFEMDRKASTVSLREDIYIREKYTTISSENLLKRCC